MATVAAYESKVLERLIPHLNAGEDLSSYQYCAMKLSSGDVVKCDTLGEFTIGILQNAPDASGKGADVCYGTCISRVKLGGTVSQLNRLVAGASATLVAQSDPDEAVIAIALSDGVSGDVIPAIVCQGTALNSAVVERALADGKMWVGNGSGEAAAVTMSGDGTLANTGAITITDVTVGSDAAGDILYKSSATALARLAKGTAADVLQQGSSNAPQWATLSGDATIADGGAVTVTDVTVGSDAAGDILYKSSATALARLAKGTTADVLQQGASNAPQWATLSGDATIADGGAVTVTDVTVGSDATGDILYKSSATALARLAIGTAGQMLLTNSGANAPEWASMSGDATIAAGGAVTVATDVLDESNNDRSTMGGFFEDFLGNIVIPDQGSLGEGAMWSTKDTSAAGSPTKAIVGDAADGHFQFAFAANDEAEILTLYWNDELNIDIDKDPVFIWRVSAASLNANDTLVFGAAAAQNDTPDSVTAHAWFRLEGSLALLCESDDGTNDNDDTATAVTLTASTFYEFKIDFGDTSDVLFYYRASLGGAWTGLATGTTFDMSNYTSNLQPFMQFQKSGGTQTTAVLVDYVRGYWSRT